MIVYSDVNSVEMPIDLGNLIMLHKDYAMVVLAYFLVKCSEDILRKLLN